MSNEDLRAKYGRGTTNKAQEKEVSNVAPADNSKTEAESKYGRNNTYTKKTKETLTPQQKEIKENIANVISQYAQENKSFNTQQKNEIKPNQESLLIKTIKGFIMFLIVAIVICIIVALIAKPQVEAEGDIIIDQIKKTEDLYYSKMHKYHYFSKTDYDQTLGIDMSLYKYFSTCEVIPNEETGNYEAKIHGATNAFTMTYYYLKSLLVEKGILE